MEKFALVDGDILNIVDGDHKGEVVMFLSQPYEDTLLCCDNDDNSIEFEIEIEHAEYDGGY